MPHQASPSRARTPSPRWEASRRPSTVGQHIQPAVCTQGPQGLQPPAHRREKMEGPAVSGGLQSHSQCSQHSWGPRTSTGWRPLEQVGMGGVSHSTSTSSTVLLYLQIAMVQLHSHHVSFSYGGNGSASAEASLDPPRPPLEAGAPGAPGRRQLTASHLTAAREAWVRRGLQQT